MYVGPYLKFTFAQEWKLYVPGTTFFVAFGDSVPACFDIIGKGMDTVPTRFGCIAIQNILTLKISGSFIGANTIDTAMPHSFHNQLLVNS